jgi:hypothetical protein
VKTFQSFSSDQTRGPGISFTRSSYLESSLIRTRRRALRVRVTFATVRCIVPFSVHTLTDLGSISNYGTLVLDSVHVRSTVAHPGFPISSTYPDTTVNLFSSQFSIATRRTRCHICPFPNFVFLSCLSSAITNLIS